MKKGFNMTELRLSLAECVTWTAILMIECVAIVTLNFLTIIVFIRNRDTRKRSAYLLINLAAVDMLLGLLRELMTCMNLVWIVISGFIK